MNYYEEQSKSGFKIGDKIIVLRKSTKEEDEYWGRYLG